MVNRRNKADFRFSSSQAQCRVKLSAHGPSIVRLTYLLPFPPSEPPQTPGPFHARCRRSNLQTELSVNEWPIMKDSSCEGRTKKIGVNI